MRNSFLFAAAIAITLLHSIDAGAAEPIPTIKCGITDSFDAKDDGSFLVKAPSTGANMSGRIRRQLAQYWPLNILAPRGWKCSKVHIDSGGISFSITPDGRTDHDAQLGLGIFYRDTPNHGGWPEAQDYAIKAHRLFKGDPTKLERDIPGFTYVNRDQPEWSSPKGIKPFPTDRLIRLGSTTVRFETPANRQGAGTILLNDLGSVTSPYRSTGIADFEGEELIALVVRLPKKLQPLEKTIVEAFLASLQR